MTFRWPNQNLSFDKETTSKLVKIANPWHLKIGKRVFQEKYGWGKVTKVENRAGIAQISIKFDNNGIDRDFNMETVKILA